MSTLTESSHAPSTGILSGPSSMTPMFKTTIVAQAYEYWMSKASGGPLPSRFDLRPEDMRQFLSCVFLVDVTIAPLSFRYRLVGTQIGRWADRDYTGFTLETKSLERKWSRIFDDSRSSARARRAMPCALPLGRPASSSPTSESSRRCRATEAPWTHCSARST
jgi:hypothetical protein